MFTVGLGIGGCYGKNGSAVLLTLTSAWVLPVLSVEILALILSLKFRRLMLCELSFKPQTRSFIRET